MISPRARSKSSRGLTLVDALTAMFILVILMSMAVALYIQGSQHFARTTTDLDAEREARAAMGKVAGELRQAMPPQGTNLPPVVSPTAPKIFNPSPTPTAQVVFYKVDDIAGAVSGTTLNVSAMPYDKVVIEQDPLAAAPPDNLLEYVYDASTGTLKSTTVIGHDVETFGVTPLRPDAYDLQIVTAPNIRKDLLDPNNPALHTYALTSTVFISYYPTNDQ